MPAKRVQFGVQPKAQPSVDEWVEKREVPISEEVAPPPTVSSSPTETPEEKMKRLTLDIPESLHRKIKGRAVMEGVTMVEMLRELLEATYG